MSMRTTIRGYLYDVARAFDKAPVEVGLAFACAVLISYSIETKNTEDVALQFVVAALIAGAFAWSATLLHALNCISMSRRWIVTFAGGVAAALYLLSAPEQTRDADGWRVFMLLSAAALTILAVPGWAGIASDANLRLRRINGRVLLRAIGIALYGLALYAGLALALLAIDNLFELKLGHKIYGHVFVWIMAVLVPWVIVGGLDDYVRPLEEESDVARVVHRLTRFLVPLLVAIYYLILIAYTIRIAATGELPKNLVSPMVIAAGLLAAIGLILFDPDTTSSASLRWLRYVPVPFILLAPLGIWALYARIDAYGWTEFRLLRLIVLLTLLSLAVLAVPRLLRRRAYALRVIPTLLAVVLIASALGPWSVLSVARRDQQQRLLSALRKARVNLSVPATADTTPRTVPRSLFVQINSTASYLESHFGEDALPKEIPVRPRQWRARGSLANYYHLAPALPDTAEQFYSGSLMPGVGIGLSDGRAAYRVNYSGPKAPGTATHLSNDTLQVMATGETLYVPLRDVLAAARARTATDRSLSTNAAHAVAVNAQGAARGELLIFELSFSEARSKREIRSLQGLLLLTTGSKP